MKLTELKIGQKVKVNSNSRFYEDWEGMVCTVVGIYQEVPDHTKENISVNDGMVECDGFTAAELDAI